MTENVFVQKLLRVSTLQPLALAVFPHHESDPFLPTVFWMTCIKLRSPNCTKVGGNKWCRSLIRGWQIVILQSVGGGWGLLKKQRDPGLLIWDIRQRRRGEGLLFQPIILIAKLWWAEKLLVVAIHAVYVTLTASSWLSNPHFPHFLADLKVSASVYEH